MRWNELKLNELRWDEMRKYEMKWEKMICEKREDEIRNVDLKWENMKWAKLRWEKVRENEMRREVQIKWEKSRWNEKRWDKMKMILRFSQISTSACWEPATAEEGSAASTQRARSVARERSAVGRATNSLTTTTAKVSWATPTQPLFIQCASIDHGLFKAVWFLWCVYPDIDECETGIHNCGKEFTCQNTKGSFRCFPNVRCGAGFIQDALGNCIGEQLLTATHGNFTHATCVCFLHRPYLYKVVISDILVNFVDSYKVFSNWPHVVFESNEPISYL